MVKNHLVWTKRSQQHMRALYRYISEDSPQNAAKVVTDIIAAAEKAIVNPITTTPINIKSIMTAAIEPLKNTVTVLFIVTRKISSVF